MKVFGKFIGAVAVATVAVAMVSCSKVPSSGEAMEKMLALGYDVDVIAVDDVEFLVTELGGDGSNTGAITGIDAENEEGEELETMFAIWFETEQAAKNFEVLFESQAQEMKYDNLKWGVKDEIYYWGTAQAIEDFFS